jgi:hypothetical protein
MDRLTATNRLNDGGRMIVENPQASELYAPLTNSIIPQSSMGAVTYSRATIATVTDNDWIIRNCLSGEARFLGARRVRNIATFSEDAGNAAWTKSRATITSNSVIDPDGKLVGDTLVWDGTGISYFFRSIAFEIGNKYRVSICFKAADISTVSITSFTQAGACSFDLAGGTAGTPTGIGSAASIQALANGWYRCSVLFTASSTGNTNMWFGSANYLWNICYVVRMQVEDVTGQSIQTVGDYVSTSVLTTAPFHGSNVDGVKCFNTTLSWATISPSTLKGYLYEASKTNLIVQSNNFAVTWTKNVPQTVITSAASVWPDGGLSMTKLSPGATPALQSMVATATVTAAIHTFSVYAKAGENTILQLLTQWTVSAWYCNFNLATGTVGSSSLWTGVMESMWNGIYRCTAITDTLVAGAGWFHISQVPTPITGRAGNIDGDGVSGLYVYGAQLELWDFPSSYIPTTTVAVARNIDVLSYNSANAVGSRGAAYIEASLILPWNTVSAAASRFALSRGANGRMFYVGSTINNINNFDWTTVLASNPWTSMNGNVVKMASSWSGSTKGIYYGSTVPKTSAFDGTMGTGNIDVGSSWNGTVRNLRIWKTPPTVAELTSITTL